MADTPAADTDRPADEPKSRLSRLGAALPVGLTVLATAFASMSNGALQQAMYWKSQAAQDQAKATDQWTLAGLKRDRSLITATAAAQLRAAAGDAAPRLALPPARASDPTYRKALDWLTGEGDRAGPPPAPLPEVTEESIRDLVRAIKARRPEAELVKLAGRVKQEAISRAIDDAEGANQRIDEEWGPVIKAAGELASGAGPGGVNAATRAARQAAVYELERRRFRAEARRNQAIGFLYEARVKVSGAASDRHRRRSQQLIYAMLAAQLGATIASLDLARRRRSVLWLAAGLLGLAALGLGAYVFLTS